jgi:hypothetical protein
MAGRTVRAREKCGQATSHCSWPEAKFRSCGAAEVTEWAAEFRRKLNRTPIHFFLRAMMAVAVRRVAPWWCAIALAARPTREEAAAGFLSRPAIVGTRASAE